MYDLVIDVMHAIALNLVKSELKTHLLGRGNLCKDKLAKALKCVQWTHELKDGGVPSVSSSSSQDNRYLGHWKSEDYSKFVLVAPCVLHSLIPQENYLCFMLLCRIHQLVYNKTMRVQGWEKEDVVLLKHLWSHAIAYEKLYGLSACTENTEYSLHIPEDIKRHSLPDNYWCYMYERQVRFYKQQSTDQKQICKTFSNRASQLRFITEYFACQPLQKSGSGLLSSISLTEPVLLAQKTVDQAYKLKDELSNNELTPTIATQYQSGILIGTPRFTQISPRQHNDIKYWVTENGPGVEVSMFVQSFSKVLKVDSDDFGCICRVGDYVIIEDADTEWVMQLTSLFVCGPFSNLYYQFIDGDYFVARTRGVP